MRNTFYKTATMSQQFQPSMGFSMSMTHLGFGNNRPQMVQGAQTKEMKFTFENKGLETKEEVTIENQMPEDTGTQNQD